MILESIKINNIRSIKKLDLEFPQSTILFYGDIGSGKTSVLKAIEFALFGTLKAADLSGDSILRRGENKASVELTFIIDGQQYTIKRGLSRNTKGTVSQTKGSIISNDVETSYAPTDLRRNVLETLNYSITRYEKAQKVDLFRYTVYTPQESVKEILEADPKNRFEILKDVFGIEKYEIALKNLDIITKYLGDKKKEITTLLTQYEGLEDDIPLKEEELQNQITKTTELTKASDIKQNEINEFKKTLGVEKQKKEEVSKKIFELNNEKQKIASAQQLQEQYAKNLSDAQKNIKDNEKEASKIELKEMPDELSEDTIQKQIKKIRESIIKNETDRAVLTNQIENIDKLLEEGKCSLCGQEIHEKIRFEQELEAKKQKIETHSKKIEEFKENEKESEKTLQDLRDFTSNKAKKEMYLKIVESAKKQEIEAQRKLKEGEAIITNLQQDLNDALKTLKVSDVESLTTLEQELKGSLVALELKAESLTVEKGEIDVELSRELTIQAQLEKEIKELKKMLEMKAKLTGKLEYITDLREWAKEQFPTLLRDIEGQILVSSAQYFNSYFKQWFNLLVEEGNIEVEIRIDDFQPMINVNGYESPFKDLSGGEKSAISLAYRLALSKIINEKYQDVKTKDLIILDEPTDGFSQQQVNRMQEIFSNLNTAQMIIISHERALDSFVTDIYTFKKSNHITKVERESM